MGEASVISLYVMYSDNKAILFCSGCVIQIQIVIRLQLDNTFPHNDKKHEPVFHELRVIIVLLP